MRKRKEAGKALAPQLKKVETPTTSNTTETESPVQPIDIELTVEEQELLSFVSDSHKEQFSEKNAELAKKLFNIAETRKKLETMEGEIRKELESIAQLETSKVDATVKSIMVLGHGVNAKDIIYAMPYEGTKKVRLMLKSMMN